MPSKLASRVNVTLRARSSVNEYSSSGPAPRLEPSHVAGGMRPSESEVFPDLLPVAVPDLSTSGITTGLPHSTWHLPSQPSPGVFPLSSHCSPAAIFR